MPLSRRSFLVFLASLPLISLAKPAQIINDEAVADAVPMPLIAQDHIFVDDMTLFSSTFARLKKMQSLVGHGRFNIISFDELLRAAKNSPTGSFSKNELNLIGRLFYEDPKKYGFLGRRTTESLTHKINPKELFKVPHTGHYLFKGSPLNAYNRLIKDIGPSLYLTSGVRGVPKQLYLYMNKILRENGDITLASRSLAPPAHTYHSIGDFDVGKRGFGERFEPWHIQIIKEAL